MADLRDLSRARLRARPRTSSGVRPMTADLRAPEIAARGRQTRIVILGGGFGGVYTASHLERLLRHRPDVEVVLVSRDNFLLMTPLLFEVCSGTLDLRHCAFPVRAFLRG